MVIGLEDPAFEKMLDLKFGQITRLYNCMVSCVEQVCREISLLGSDPDLA